jgi:hypothetical protein
VYLAAMGTRPGWYWWELRVTSASHSKKLIREENALPLLLIYDCRDVAFLSLIAIVIVQRLSGVLGITNRNYYAAVKADKPTLSVLWV